MKHEAGKTGRQPGKGKTVKVTAKVQQRLSRDHVIVTTQNTPLTHHSGPYHALMRCCATAGIQTQTRDAEGRLVEHVDLHSLRRTFATNLISAGADPKSVHELLGLRTLEMTLRIYAKIHGGTKRRTLGRLSYGQGTLAPEGVLAYPCGVGPSIPVQNGHQTVTGQKRAVGG